MRTHFTEVLTRESACLAGITDTSMLASWRHRVVQEIMTPASPYVLALQNTRNTPGRTDFLDQWRELIAVTLDRLLRSAAAGGRRRTSTGALNADVDAQKTAVLILAALHGGSALSQIAQDPRPLNAALDLALVPFAAMEHQSPAKTGNEPPTE